MILISIYKQYLSHRPIIKNVESGMQRFYLRPLAHATGNVWFTPYPLGDHAIGKSIKTMATNAKIEGYFTAHSLRATLATRLYHRSCDEQLISEITGHRSNSIREYKRTCDAQLMDVSEILNSACLNDKNGIFNNQHTRNNNICNDNTTKNETTDSAGTAENTSSSLTYKCDWELNKIEIQGPQSKKMQLVLFGKNCIKVSFVDADETEE